MVEVPPKEGRVPVLHQAPQPRGPVPRRGVPTTFGSENRPEAFSTDGLLIPSHRLWKPFCSSGLPTMAREVFTGRR